MIDNRNLILAIVLSLAILLGFEFFVGGPQRERLAEQQRQEQAMQAERQGGTTPQPDVADIPGPTVGDGATPLEASAGLSRELALERSPRVAIRSPKLTGSIALKGGRIDDLVLRRYRETVEPESRNIELLSPADSPQAYFAHFGWSSGDRALELFSKPVREPLRNLAR